MERRRVLVIRPQPGADQTAARLIPLGFDPVVLPLTQTVALEQSANDFRPDLIVATSPQAFRHLSRPLASTFSLVRVLVTGAATAQAARDAGFADVQASGGDAARLIEMLTTTVRDNSSVLYLAGRVRRPDLDHALEKGGFEHRIFEVYDTLPVSYSTDNLTDIASRGRVGAVLLTSVESVGQLARHAGTPIIGQMIENAHFICLSSRVAEAAGKHFQNTCRVPVEPTEAALLELLQATFNRAN
ncbi:MAG: uroporphyrinogen-III synthase [Rhizobiaceae bacterium]